MTTTTRTTTDWCVAPGVDRLDPTTAGFWRSIVRPSYAMDVWAKVTAAVRRGELGPAARLKPLAGGRRYELRIYVSDVSDQAAVLRIRRALRFRLGFVRPIACYDWQGRRRWRDPGAAETTPKELWWQDQARAEVLTQF